MSAVARPKPNEAFDFSPSGAPDTAPLLVRHDLFFETRIADSAALIATAQALRYQVYCLERRFENPEQHLGGLETDTFDRHARHGVLFHRPSLRAIGTVRMIAPRGSVTDSLPIQSLLRHDNLDLGAYVDMERTVEISRFAISKDFRRRHTDGFEDTPLSRADMLRQANLASLSLIQFLVRQSVADGILYWAAVMEPRLLRMLAGMGIRFTSIGSLVLHHGLRQPCYCHVPSMLEQVRREHPDYWSVLTSDGAHGWQPARHAPGH
jgi:N-acyl amino acid synthase of PEP-CTERM/exosortase system